MDGPAAERVVEPTLDPQVAARVWSALSGSPPARPVTVGADGRAVLAVPRRQRSRPARLPVQWDTAPAEHPDHPLFAPPAGPTRAARELGSAASDPAWAWVRSAGRAPAAVVVLRYVAGLGDAEIAGVLSSSESEVVRIGARVEGDAGAGDTGLGATRLAAAAALARAWHDVPVAPVVPRSPSGRWRAVPWSPTGRRAVPRSAGRRRRTLLGASAAVVVVAVVAVVVVAVVVGSPPSPTRRAVPARPRTVRLPASTGEEPAVVPGVFPLGSAASGKARIPVLAPPFGRPVLQQFFCRRDELVPGPSNLAGTGDLTVTAVTLVDVGDRSCLLSAQPDAHVEVAGRYVQLPLLPSSATARDSLLLVPAGGRISLQVVVSVDGCPPHADPLVRPTLVVDLPGGARRFLVQAGPAQPCSVRMGLWSGSDTVSTG